MAKFKDPSGGFTPDEMEEDAFWFKCADTPGVTYELAKRLCKEFEVNNDLSKEEYEEQMAKDDFDFEV